MMHTAVLFLVFNRPDLTEIVFEAIRKAKPPRIYLAADGPRNDNDKILCDKVRQIISSVDWPCEVKTLYHNNNLGCKIAVSTAISWFFENEEEGIILEDDILPDTSFFTYCEKLLDYYRNSQHVMMISGCNPVSGKYVSPYSYEFSNYSLVWGWASWKRAWKLYDVNMVKWPIYKKKQSLKTIPNVTKNFEAIWTDIYEKTYNNQIDTWDFQWFFAINTNHSFMIIPKENLIINLGFREDATHSHQGTPDYIKNLLQGKASKELVHPPSISNNVQIDHLFETVLFNTNKFTYLKFILKNILGHNTVSKIRTVKSIINSKK